MSDSKLVMTRRALLVGTPLAVLAARSDVFAARGGGSLIFLSRTFPRDFRGNPRTFANQNKISALQEDTAQGGWRINFVAFLSSGASSEQIELTWFKMPRGGGNPQLVNGANETIELSDPHNPVYVHQTFLARRQGLFNPNEKYVGVLTDSGGAGSRTLARGEITLNGYVAPTQHDYDFRQPGGSAPPPNRPR